MTIDTKPRRLALALLLAGSTLAGLAQAATAADNAPRLIVTNRSANLVNTLQVSPSSSDQWGEDLLGRLQLLPNGAVAVNFPAGAECTQDVRVVYHGGGEEVRMRVDACASHDLAFDGSGARSPQPGR